LVAPGTFETSRNVRGLVAMGGGFN
jgi:hypothetical protein